MADTKTETCDVDNCKKDVAQQFTTEGGRGDTISRCETHAVPEYDWATSWVFTLPKPKK